MEFLLSLDGKAYLDQIPQIQSLFTTVFGRNIPADFIRWRYAENPMGLITSLTVQNSDSVEAHYASTPNEFTSSIGTLRGSMVAAVMTNPASRGKGLFQSLGYKHEVQMKELGFDFLYAFPNRNSDPIFIHKLGWQSVYEIPFLSLNIEKKMSQTIETDNDFSRFDYDALTDRKGMLCARRTKKFFRWRYHLNPVNKYTNLVIADQKKLMAYAIVKKYQEKAQLDILDFYLFDENKLALLFNNIISYASQENCKTVSTWCPRHYFAHQYLTKIGFQHQLPITYLTYKPLHKKLNNKYDKFNNWWITMGDSDVF